MFDSDVDDEYIREYAFEPELLINRDDYRKREEQKEEQREAIKRRSSLRRKSQRKASADSYESGGQQKNQIDVEIEAFYYMYGRYTKDLGEFAKDEARKLKLLEKRRKHEDRQRNKELLGKRSSRMLKVSSWIWKRTFARLGEDWVFLALLGVIMAFVSYVVDKGINVCTNARVWLYRDLTSQPITQYLAWVSLPVCLILFSAGFVHLIAPQSIGSGIPEMKTILRGVALKEYLTFKTLVAKVVGLTATLGSGMPLGKEGPFCHIASIVAQLLSKLVTSFQGIYENESRNSEMLAAACAVGVGSCFAAPVGGVLFSIEVTTTYFAVRNYWRGFFAAVCGATVFRLLAVWFHNADTVRAIFLTNFTTEFPFDPQELFVFALMGVVSGIGGAAYVWVHRRYVLFMRSNKKMNKFLQKNRFLYPGFLALLVSTLSFPLGTGQFIAGELSTHEQVTQLFSNFTWSRDDLTVEQAAIVTHWVTSYTNIFINLSIYIVFTFFISIVASTIPVPSGIFIPVFKIGASLGRLIGESMHLWFPNGVRYGGRLSPIIPGGYAVVGAAAFSGAVTHTVSVAVIIFEMTGQITHVVPVMIAVLIANAIAALLQPSMYDSIILIKKLPYLPDLLPSSSAMYSIYVEDFMVRDVKYIWHGISYQKLKEVLKTNKTLRSLPLVDSHENMILLGSVQRYELIKMIEKHIGREKRMEVAQKWQKEAEERAREEEKKKQEAELKMRRPSRFEVLPAPDILSLRQIANDEMLPAKQRQESLNNNLAPRKSILKKTNSFNLKTFGPTSPHSPNITPYTTITGTEHRIRSAFEAIFRKSNTLQDVHPDPDASSISPAVSANEMPHVQRVPSISKKVQLQAQNTAKSTDPDCKPSPPNSPDSTQNNRLSQIAPNSPGPSKKQNSLNNINKRPRSLSSSPVNAKVKTKLANTRWDDTILPPPPKKGILRKSHSTTECSNTKASAIKWNTFTDSTNSDESKTMSMKKTKSVTLPRERVIDMSPEDQKKWEMEEMSQSIDLEQANVNIDPSPFQLVERTSILKVHSLFSMVGINHAYVTKIGRLVGVVGLKELRKAIEDINSNNFVVQNQIKDDVEADHRSAAEKPLLTPPLPRSPHSTSDKEVNTTVTSMDSALSHSDNCSDIEMEHMKGDSSGEEHQQPQHNQQTYTPTGTTMLINNTSNEL
ncbi:chloride channel protein 2 isoform X1 [Anastrepha ludens]|uniref:chloride channel protein 2 isoform X1 n=1 Tax=Anastrepha ludens TaxID=28586 RepID=UPI0023AFE985|nr:chloride channel protein 2 isoform X1 [Anastrepha ludens]XP_053969927.1 chloride channel protein 2 isoform X1 [Anastrepha ludens]XP_053969928.1 chloride channel protein 2 isoform X1 [Anastrepha ludens]